MIFDSLAEAFSGAIFLTLGIPIGIIPHMDNKTIILSRALEAFAARGYDGVGVQEIAAAAGVTKPTLYHYFGSKQGLLTALMDIYLEPFNQQVAAAAEYRGDLPATLTALARVYFSYAKEQPVFYRMLLAMSYAPHNSEARLVSATQQSQQYHLVEAVFFSAARDHGNMRGRHQLFAANFIGLMNTSISLWLNGSVELDDTLLQQVVRQFQYGIYS